MSPRRKKKTTVRYIGPLASGRLILPNGEGELALSPGVELEVLTETADLLLEQSANYELVESSQK
jgi:hypothetical protein